VRDVWLRTGLSPRVLERLADADAFGSFGLTRREALWAAKALGRVGDRDDDLPLFSADGGVAPARIVSREPDVHLPPMPIGEEVINDYRFLHLSLRAHPSQFLRADLKARGITRNEALRNADSGARMRISGLVTCRQRPGSANGVVFMTIEDESAVANVIVWPKVFERLRPVILGARYVAVTGRVQEDPASSWSPNSWRISRNFWRGWPTTAPGSTGWRAATKCAGRSRISAKRALSAAVKTGCCA
jgi:error-prone DNA polymerase